MPAPAEGSSSDDDGTHSAFHDPVSRLDSNTASQDIMSMAADMAVEPASDMSLFPQLSNMQQRADSSVMRGRINNTAASWDGAAASASAGGSDLSLKQWQPQAAACSSSSNSAGQHAPSRADWQETTHLQQHDPLALQQHRRQAMHDRYRAAAVHVLRKSGFITDTGW